MDNAFGINDWSTKDLGDTQVSWAGQELNLKGKICPYTFIETMLALEEMKPGEILRVILDYPPAVCDVPRSLRNEGYEVLEVKPLNDKDWAILVRNKEIG